MQYIAIDKLKVADWPTRVGAQTNGIGDQQIPFQSFLRDVTPKSPINYSQPVEPKREATQVARASQQNNARSADSESPLSPPNSRSSESSSSVDYSAEKGNNSTPDASTKHNKKDSRTEFTQPEKSQANNGENEVARKQARDTESLESELKAESKTNTETHAETDPSLANQPHQTKLKPNAMAQQDTRIENPNEEPKATILDATDLTLLLDKDELPAVDWLALVEQGKNAELENQIVENGIAKIFGKEALVSEAAKLEDSIRINLLEKTNAENAAAESVLISEEQLKSDLQAFNVLSQDFGSQIKDPQTEKEGLLEALTLSLQNLKDNTLSEAELDTELQALSEIYAALSKLTENTEVVEAAGLNPLQTSLDLEKIEIAPPTLDDQIEGKQVDQSATTLDTNVVNNNDEAVDVLQKQDIELLNLVATEAVIGSEIQPSEESATLAQLSPIASATLLNQGKENQEPTGNSKEEQRVEALKLLQNAPAEIKRLVDLPDQKLDAALNNIAQRLVTDVEKIATNSQQLTGIEKALSVAESSTLKTDFVNALKAGLEEFKSQLKQGHQPAIDLTALVAESMAKVTHSVVTPEAVSQTVSRFNQSLEIASLLNTRAESSQAVASLEKVTTKENFSQAQVLQNKQGQQLAQFDKAVNITRNEGLQQMAEKVRWMVNQNNLLAEIRLDPPDLGAMKVRVNMAGDAASVSIVVQSQQARDVLEQATPRLKEMLEKQGIELGQSSVQQESKQNGEEQQGMFAGSDRNSQELAHDESTVVEQPIRNGRVGGIDYFV